MLVPGRETPLIEDIALQEAILDAALEQAKNGQADWEATVSPFSEANPDGDDLALMAAALHLMAASEEAFDNRGDAVKLARSAIYTAGLALSFSPGDRTQPPTFVQEATDRTIHQSSLNHGNVVEAAETGATAAMLQISSETRRLSPVRAEKWKEVPKQIRQQRERLRASYYQLTMLANIAQDQFLDVDPSPNERDIALWEMLRTAFKLAKGIGQEKGHEVLRFAREVVDIYESPYAEHGDVLDIRDACYHKLATYYRHRPFNEQSELVTVRIRQDEILRERKELGLPERPDSISCTSPRTSWPIIKKNIADLRKDKESSHTETAVARGRIIT